MRLALFRIVADLGADCAYGSKNNSALAFISINRVRDCLLWLILLVNSA
jgi:hypothetical protein